METQMTQESLKIGAKASKKNAKHHHKNKHHKHTPEIRFGDKNDRTVPPEMDILDAAFEIVSGTCFQDGTKRPPVTPRPSKS